MMQLKHTALLAVIAFGATVLFVAGARPGCPVDASGQPMPHPG